MKAPSSEFWGIMIVGILIWKSLFIVGAIVKKTKSGWLVSGFDPNCDDNDAVADLFGKGMMFTAGILFVPWLMNGILYFVLDENKISYLGKVYIFSTVFILFAMCFKLYWMMNQLRKKQQIKSDRLLHK